MPRDRVRTLDESRVERLADFLRQFSHLLNTRKDLDPLHIEPEEVNPPDTYPRGV